MGVTDTFQEVFDGIFGEAFNLLVERQRKYGPKNVESLGLFGVFNRLSDDKVERIRRAMNGKIEHGRIELDDFEDFGDESFEDALFDIANYALIMIALKRGLWGKPLAPETALVFDEEDEPGYPGYVVTTWPAGLTAEPTTLGHVSSTPNEDCKLAMCCGRPGAVAHDGPCTWCLQHYGEARD